MGFAGGLRHVLHPGRAGTWGPLLIALSGAGLIMVQFAFTTALALRMTRTARQSTL